MVRRRDIAGGRRGRALGVQGPVRMGRSLSSAPRQRDGGGSSHPRNADSCGAEGAWGRGGVSGAGALWTGAGRGECAPAPAAAGGAIRTLTPPPLFFYGIHSLMFGGYTPTAIGYPPTAIGYPPAAIGYTPTAIGYTPTAIGYPPTAIGYTPTAIGYTPTAIVGRIGHSECFFFHYGTPWAAAAGGGGGARGRGAAPHVPGASALAARPTSGAVRPLDGALPLPGPRPVRTWTGDALKHSPLPPPALRRRPCPPPPPPPNRRTRRAHLPSSAADGGAWGLGPAHADVGGAQRYHRRAPRQWPPSKADRSVDPPRRRRPWPKGTQRTSPPVPDSGPFAAGALGDPHGPAFGRFDAPDAAPPLPTPPHQSPGVPLWAPTRSSSRGREGGPP